jgi:hypothetical protein
MAANQKFQALPHVWHHETDHGPTYQKGLHSLPNLTVGKFSGDVMSSHTLFGIGDRRFRKCLLVQGLFFGPGFCLRAALVGPKRKADRKIERERARSYKIT